MTPSSLQSPEEIQAMHDQWEMDLEKWTEKDYENGFRAYVVEDELRYDPVTEFFVDDLAADGQYE